MSNNQLTIDFTPQAIFFDIDDTLSRDGKLAAQSEQMLRALAKTDIKIFIATGRPLPMMPADILGLFDEGIFDAIICANGQYSYTKEQVVSQYPLTLAQSEQIAKICRDIEIIYKFESTTQMAWSENAMTHPKLKDYIETNPHFIIDPDFYQNNTVYQCSVFFVDDYRMHDIDFAQYGLKLVVWHEMGADILPIAASKARGILDICTHFDIDAKKSLAFGDGMNDIEMFNLVGCGVAMADCAEGLKQHAKHITNIIEEDGIKNVLVELGILS